jgi:alginate production protein
MAAFKRLWRLAAACAVAGAAAAQAQPGPAESAEAAPVVRRVDDRRPEQPTTVRLAGQAVELSGSWEYGDEKRQGFDLDPARARDRRVRGHEVKLEAMALVGPGITAFVQGVGLHETRKTEGAPQAQRKQALERGEAWLQWDRVGGSPFGLQVGRVPLIDRRAWWWDDDLDALRLRYGAGAVRLDTGLARTVARVSSAESGIDPAERGVRRWFGNLRWEWSRRHTLELFWLQHQDRSGVPTAGTAWPAAGDADPDTSDLQARWSGLRAAGEWRPQGLRLAYWADAAWLRGREAATAEAANAAGVDVAGTTVRRRLRSHGWDLGATLALEAVLRPSISLGYARGSGGERSDAVDTHFRQTGLHENKARLGGVKRLQMYGELLRPDLSNLGIATVGAGVRVLGNSSVELVWHRYRQVVPDATVAAARLSADPEGLDRRLGRELGVAVALREWSRLELTLRWSRFSPGPAYAADRREPAYALEVGAELNF